MADRELLERLVVTPWVSSFIGRAHDGNLYDPDYAHRCSAWAHWTVMSLEQFQGHNDRKYVGVVLPGRFHDPKGTGPQVRPHLEIPSRVLQAPDPFLPERMALAGNAIVFPWWVVSEVVAARRALLAYPPVSIEPLSVDLLRYRASLTQSVEDLNETVKPLFDGFARLLVTSPGDVVDTVTGSFDTSELSDFFPPAGELSLRVDYDEKLRESNGPWASRRVGVWKIRGLNNGQEFSMGVLTPRLTQSSLFTDPMFLPVKEGLGALLVRGLLLRRIARFLTGSPSGTLLQPDPTESHLPKPYLRSVVAKVGSKIPEASIPAAVNFLQVYPDPVEAWKVLSAWAQHGHSILTVSEEDFTHAHTQARRLLRRAESPERSDVNVVLPLAWDEKGRVVRVTFSRPADGEE